MKMQRQDEQREPISGQGLDSRNSAPSRPRVRVMLVDDSQRFLDAAREALAQVPEMLVVAQARSGVEALENLRRVSPDLLLTDLVMPAMDGLELTRRVKSEPAAPKVIVVTQFNGPDSREGAFAAGADGYLPKQHFVTELPGLVSQLFGQRDV